MFDWYCKCAVVLCLALLLLQTFAYQHSLVLCEH